MKTVTVCGKQENMSRLTFNGNEFKHTRDLETTEDGKKRTKVFYCDPQASWQKPQI